MDRAEHLQWAKDRALEYADMGDVANAMASLGSDLNKHPDTKGPRRDDAHDDDGDVRPA